MTHEDCCLLAQLLEGSWLIPEHEGLAHAQLRSFYSLSIPSTEYTSLTIIYVISCTSLSLQQESAIQAELNALLCLEDQVTSLLQTVHSLKESHKSRQFPTYASSVSRVTAIVISAPSQGSLLNTTQFSAIPGCLGYPSPAQLRSC